jgi:hypothetical protein
MNYCIFINSEIREEITLDKTTGYLSFIYSCYLHSNGEDEMRYLNFDVIKNRCLVFTKLLHLSCGYIQ